jgi:outer membrane lipoprotein-sorting protein
MNQVLGASVVSTMRNLKGGHGGGRSRVVLGIAIAVLMLSGCSSSRQWSPLAGFPSGDLAPVRTSAMSAELEFDAIVEAQRLRLDGVWVSEGPDKFRLELRAPTGGVVFSIATNGEEITCYDARAGKYFFGRASPRGFDLLLPIAPLSLEGQQWLTLLLGGFMPPPDASFEQADDGSIRGRFIQGVTQVSATFDSDRYLREIRLGSGSPNEVVVSYGKRDIHGRSVETSIEDIGGHHRMRMKLRDIEEVSTFPSKVFRIKQPKSAEAIPL